MGSMSKSRPSDVNNLAARIVAEATGQAEKTEPPWEDDGSDDRTALES